MTGVECIGIFNKTAMFAWRDLSRTLFRLWLRCSIYQSFRHWLQSSPLQALFSPWVWLWLVLDVFMVANWLFWRIFLEAKWLWSPMSPKTSFKRTFEFSNVDPEVEFPTKLKQHKLANEIYRNYTSLKKNSTPFYFPSLFFSKRKCFKKKMFYFGMRIILCCRTGEVLVLHVPCFY